MVEARAAIGGVGLVKLMGRHSGFIAGYAALAPVRAARTRRNREPPPAPTGSRSRDRRVHAGMAGRTDMVVGRRHNRFVHVPISLVVSERNQVAPDGDLWLSVLESTGQPMRMGVD